jgi:hypothetical protein
VSQAIDQKNLRLLAQAQRFLAIAQIERKEWKSAARTLELAAQQISSAESADAFLLRKWTAVMDLKRGLKDAEKNLRAIRSEAILRRDTETIRNCDFHLALQCLDWPLAQFHYFGTPFERYRKQFRTRCEAAFAQKSMPTDYAWRLGLSKKASSDRRINILDATIANGREATRAGGLPHRLLAFLASDFYKSFRPLEMYSELFPDNYYNPESSPTQLRQVIFRLRQDLARSKTQLTVEHESARFRLLANQPLELVVRDDARSPQKTSTRDEVVQAVEAQFKPGESFRARELKLDKTVGDKTVERALAWAVQTGRLTRSGRTRGVVYKRVR